VLDYGRVSLIDSSLTCLYIDWFDIVSGGEMILPLVVVCVFSSVTVLSNKTPE
jgi:hypothetical protein